MTRPSVLIVEDETIIAMELESSLQQMGYAITSVVNTGELAVRAVENQHPDIVLMDIRLAGEMNGIEAAEIIQARLRLPVIFLTAHPDKIIQDTVERSSQRAYASFLSKPYRENDLKTAIEMAIKVSEADAKRLQVEEKLAESEKKYRELTQLSNSIILKLDAERRIEFMNEFGLGFFGYSEAELLGRTLIGTIIPEKETTGRDMEVIVHDLFHHPESFIENENENITRDGKRVWISWRNKPLFKEDGSFDGLLCTGIDITHRREAEGALRKRLKELNCLYGIAALDEKPENSLQEIMQGTVHLLKDAMRHPEITEVRLKLQEGVFQTDRFEDTFQEVSTDIWVDGKQAGSIDVVLTRPLLSDGEYTVGNVETELLQAVAERIGRIVERIRTRQELIYLNSKYHELFERMSSGVAFYQAVDDGADFRFTAFNRAAESIENTKRDAVIGRRVTSVFPGIKEMGLLDVFRRVWKTGNPEMLPIKQYADNRILGWRENHVIKLPSGEIVAIYEDRTIEMQAREQIEKALQEKELSEAKYRNLYHHSPDMYFTMDLSRCTITECNQTLTRQIGYPEDQVIGAPFERFLTEQSATFFKAEIAVRLSETGEIENADLQLVCADGNILDTQLKISTLQESEGSSQQAFAVLRDETAKKQLERERSEFEKQLMHLQKMEAIATLAGGIAHDFNNILHPIVGYTRMAKKRVHLDPKTFGYLEQISTSANRARQLINQLLSFSRPDRQEFSVIDLKPVLKETLHFIKATIPASIEIERKINEDCGNIMGNPSQVHQILMNLITNAYQAMEDYGGRLSVELFPLDPTMEEWFLEDPGVKRGIGLRISDTGPGIDESIIDRIFDPYFTTKESGKGTGLGLATVQGIVKGHGGNIRVTSRKGYGTTFHIIFPQAEEDAEATAEESLKKIPTGTEHILLVDDEYRIVALEREMLEELGYTITSRTGSIDALEAFRANPERYDLVITDMNMPNMDGADLSVNLRNLRPDIPIIICTGYSSKIDPERAEAIGVRRLLQKPISFEDLAVAVREALSIQGSD